MGRTQGARTLALRRQPKARDRVWQSMRMLRRFTLPDLIVSAEAGAQNVRYYVGELHAAGYLAIAVPFRRGMVGGHQVWRLLRNTGPHAPRLVGRRTRPAIFDPNTGESVWLKTATG